MSTLTLAQQQLALAIRQLNTVVEEIDRIESTPTLDDLVSESNVRKKLGISRSTIWRYEKSGLLRPVWVGATKMYRKCEIVDLNRK